MEQQQRYIVAIETGSSVIKGALGIVDRNGILSVVAIEEERLTDCVRYGIVQNGEVVGTHIQRIIHRLERNPALNGAQITGCYTSLGGRGVISTSREFVRDFASEAEVTPEIINRLYEDARATHIPDREIIDVIPAGFTVDNLNVSNPVGTFGRTIRANFTLLTARSVIKRNLQRVIEDKVGLKIVGTVARIAAEGDLVLTPDERRLGCMLVDFGAETTTVAFYKNDALQYAVTLPLGSRNITRDITALNITEQRAEELKISVANAYATSAGTSSGFDGIDYTEINNYVGARAGEIISNIIEQARFAGFKTDHPYDVVIIGRGAKLKGFIELLAKNSKSNVRCGSATPAIRVTSASAQPMDSVDVIATLAAAARMPMTYPCVELPKPTEPEPEFDVTDTYVDTPDLDDYVPQEPRRKKKGLFGSIKDFFGSSNDDDEILIEEDEDDLLKREEERKAREQAMMRERRRREQERREAEERKARQAEERRRRREAEDERDADEESNSISAIKNRIFNIISDPEKNILGDNDKVND